MKVHFLAAVLAATLTAVCSAEAFADDAGFDRFDGAWSGGGTVKESAESKRLKVSCMLAGSHTATHLDLSGTCRALVLFTRAISADISYDPATKAYTGTYTGASVGPARLVGTRQGNGVDLVVTWPKSIDGDDKATMQIRNAGQGEFSIEIFDAPAPGAAAVKMVSIKLTQ